MIISDYSIHQPYFQEVIDISSKGIFVCDLNGNIKEANTVTVQLLGFQQEEIKMLNIYHFITSKLKKNNFIARLLLVHRIEGKEIEIRDRNGRCRKCTLTAQLIEKSDFKGYVGVLKDISVDKETETIDLSKQSAKMKEQFLANVSHEMRTPMNNIPILVMTAHAHISQEEKYKKYGWNDYILKPFQPEILFQKIGKYIFT